MINGSNLAAERETRGITLEEVQCSTKLGLHFLTAIEAEDFAQLPGGIYAISFIRQYCRAIGCDEAPLLKQYSDSRPVAEPPQQHGLIQYFFQHCAAILRRHHPA
jgi:cytoskeletal protein RodZ